MLSVGVVEAEAATRSGDPLPEAACDAPDCPGEAPSATAEIDDDVEDWLGISTAFQAYDYDEALRALEALQSKRPFDPDAAFMRGYALHRQGNDSGALQALEQAIALAPDRALPLAQRALSLAVLGKMDDAEAAIAAALALEPEDATTLAYKGQILAMKGENEAALKAADAAVEQASDSVWVLLVRSLVNLRLDRASAARTDADQAIALDPYDSSAYAVRARALATLGDRDEALADIAKAEALGAQDPSLDQLGARIANGEPVSTSPPALPSMFGDGRVDPQPRLVLALQKIRDGKAGEAVALANQILETAPWARPEVLLVRAYAALDMEEYARADADLDEVEAALGGTDEIHYLRAKVRWGQDDREGAMVSISRAVAGAPDYAPYREARALYRYEAGLMQEALEDIDSLLAVEGYETWAPQMRVTILHQLGREAEAGRQALEYIRTGHALDPSVRRTLPDIIWQLQQGLTWGLADELLAAADPPPLGEDFHRYLRARTLAYRNQLAKAVALLSEIGDHDVLRSAMSDGAFAPVWDAAELAPLMEPSTLYRRSFDAAWRLHRSQPRDLLHAVYAVGMLGDLGCRQASADAARRLEGSLSAYTGTAEWGAAVYETLAEAALAENDAEAALAAYREGIATIGADNPYAITLMLNAGQLLMSMGRYEDALRQLEPVERLSPSYGYGIAAAHFTRAIALDGLGRDGDRDAALDYLSRHARDNIIAAVYGIGLLGSREEAAALAAQAMDDHVQGLVLLDRLAPRPGKEALFDLDRRIDGLSAWLRENQEVRAAIPKAGRLQPIPANATCPLDEQELADRPFAFPFEEARPRTSDAGQSPSGTSSGQ
jgi:tetratricopeptide (TPR) repeat protein